jgi:hypothetical protein
MSPEPTSPDDTCWCSHQYSEPDRLVSEHDIHDLAVRAAEFALARGPALPDGGTPLGE